MKMRKFNEMQTELGNRIKEKLNEKTINSLDVDNFNYHINYKRFLEDYSEKSYKLTFKDRKEYKTVYIPKSLVDENGDIAEWFINKNSIPFFSNSEFKKNCKNFRKGSEVYSRFSLEDFYDNMILEFSIPLSRLIAKEDLVDYNEIVKEVVNEIKFK